MVTHDRAGEICLEELYRFALYDWSYRIRDIKEIGLCLWGPRLIVISKSLCLWNGEDQVRETVRHEVAHALTPGDKNHGPVWEAACERVGCIPRQFGHVNGPSVAWASLCDSCGFPEHFIDYPWHLGECPRCRSPRELVRL